MFGDIYTTFTTIGNFLTEGEEYKGGSIRWPGGSLAEGKTSSRIEYDLTSADIYSRNGKVDPDKGLEGMLKLAAETDQSFAMSVPTLASFQEGRSASAGQRKDILSEVYAEFDQFLDRLTKKDGYYDSGLLFEDTGKSITIEIGNETSHLGWSNGSFDSSWNYATIAGTILNVCANSNADDSGIDIDIAMQMGVNWGGAYALVNSLISMNSGAGGNLFREIDSLVSHNMLVSSARDFDVAAEAKIIDHWLSAISTHAGKAHASDVDLFASAWSVGDHRFGTNIFRDESDFVLRDKSSFDTGSAYKDYLSYISDLDGNDAGARQGFGTVDVFCKMIALGYEAATVWGTVDPSLHSNSYQSVWGPYNWGHSGENRSMPLSHGGEVLAHISENLKGYSLISGGSVSFVGGAPVWDASYFDSNSKTGAGEVNSYWFSDGDELAVLASVTDIDGAVATHDGRLSHVFDVPSGVTEVTVRSIGTEFMIDEWRSFKDNPSNANFISNMSDVKLQDFKRLFEVPVTTEYTLSVTPGKDLVYDFTSDFEVVLISFDEGFGPTTIDPSIVRGTEDADFINLAPSGEQGELQQRGGGQVKQVFGNGGDDTIILHDGDVSATGGGGHDTILGGDGTDVIEGGSGNDVLVADYAGDTDDVTINNLDASSLGFERSETLSAQTENGGRQAFRSEAPDVSFAREDGVSLQSGSVVSNPLSGLGGHESLQPGAGEDDRSTAALFHGGDHGLPGGRDGDHFEFAPNISNATSHSMFSAFEVGMNALLIDGLEIDGSPAGDVPLDRSFASMEGASALHFDDGDAIALLGTGGVDFF